MEGTFGGGPPPPRRGARTTCEMHCDLVASSLPSSFSSLFPRISLRRGYSQSDHKLRKLHALPKLPSSTKQPDFASIAQNFLAFLGVGSKPQFKDLISPQAHAARWAASPVHGAACHPFNNKIAVARFDDAVEVYSPKNSGFSVLIHEQQKDVSCLAWDPSSSCRLAVAGREGIVMWQLESEGAATVRVLPQPDGIQCMSWSPCGTLLATASPEKSTINIWDIARESSTELKRGGSAVFLLEWSPDGNHLLAATSSGTFRVWETHRWEAFPWNTAGKPLVSACWAPDSKTILLALEGDTSISSLLIDAAPDRQLKVIFDTKQQIFNDIRVGGVIEQLTWDESGERLAVSFRGDEHGSSLIAIFRTRLSRGHPELVPTGYLQGPENCYPQWMSFHKRAHSFGGDVGALLTVCWLSSDKACGEFSFIPFFFVPAQTIKKTPQQSLTFLAGLR
eukprot:m.33668 g.33668  ORF g.33668 m.33668 type:complete len:450 (-) comp15286_c0_seq3:157-1506(-)